MNIYTVFAVLDFLAHKRFLVAGAIAILIAGTNYLVLSKPYPLAVGKFVVIGAGVSFLISAVALEFLYLWWTTPNGPPMFDVTKVGMLPTDYTLYWIGAWIITIPFTWYLLWRKESKA